MLSIVESPHQQSPSRKTEDQGRKRNERLVGIVVSRSSLSFGRSMILSLKPSPSNLTPETLNSETRLFNSQTPPISPTVSSQ